MEQRKSKIKYSLDPQLSSDHYQTLFGAVTHIIAGFNREVFPVLKSFGLLSDNYLRRCLYFEDMSSIYRDAMAKDATRIEMLESIAKATGKDFWAPMRDVESKAKEPTQDGFKFRDIPWANNPIWMIDKILKCGALIVKDGTFDIDEKALKAECMISPTDGMRELFELATELCEKANALDFHENKDIFRMLFIRDGKKISPNAKGIVQGVRIPLH